MVELLATVAIIGIISFMAIPQVTRMRSEAETNLAYSRAEAINLAIANHIQVRGRSQAISDWNADTAEAARYNLIRPYLSFSEGTLSGYLPGGWDIDFQNIALEPLRKVTLKDPSGAVKRY